jgi:ferredoxin--NADP+ reductase
MTYRILAKEKLAEGVTQIVLLAPEVVRNAQAGQFVVIIADQKGERIPLTIADFDKQKGTLVLIFQEVGFSTRILGSMNVGDNVAAVLGPLGKPTQAEKVGTVFCIGGGVGIAEMLPVARAYKKANNRVIGMIGARTKKLLILEEELRLVCEELLLATDDGTAGTKGTVTDLLKAGLRKEDPALVYAVGPVAMMEKVAEATLPKKIKTIVSLNPLMVDATGMCGVCRCTVDGKPVFGCVDGPEFDAHLVDFKQLEKRLNFFKEEEEGIKKKI